MKTCVESYMIKSPYIGTCKMSLQEALDLLCEFGIRHLPIMADGKLVGIISERDLRSALALSNSQKFSVDKFMNRDVYVAEKSSPLNEVVRNMLDRKISSTIVVGHADEILGIFTLIDALKLLANLLDKEISESVVIDKCFKPWNFNSAIV